MQACQQEACNVQRCFQKHLYNPNNEDICAPLIRKLRECCKSVQFKSTACSKNILGSESFEEDYEGYEDKKTVIQ
jgi:hypothetical protein